MAPSGRKSPRGVSETVLGKLIKCYETESNDEGILPRLLRDNGANVHKATRISTAGPSWCTIYNGEERERRFEGIEPGS